MARKKQQTESEQCIRYSPGHTLAHRQLWLAAEDRGADVQRRITEVRDDGTILFVDGSVRWNHDVDGLRQVIAAYGDEVTLGSHGVMRIACGEDSYVFSLGDEPTPCSPKGAKRRQSVKEIRIANDAD